MSVVDISSEIFKFTLQLQFRSGFSSNPWNGGVIGKMSMMVPDTMENMKMCICPSCPTFRESKLTGILFCAKGKAAETVIEKGCNCPKCAVWMKYKLQNQYYCSVGKAV